MKKAVILLLAAISPLILFSQNYQINWQKCLGGSEQDQAYDIIAIPGGYFILGNTESTDGNVSFNHGFTDGWLIKTDNNGNILWERTYGGSSGDNFVRIFPTDNSQYYILGASRSSDGDVTFDPYLESWDHWILKIDIEGNIIWDKIAGGSAGEVLWTGDITEDGGIVTVGWTNSNDGDISVFYGGQDSWITKINSDGELEWDFTIGTDFIDVGQAIIQTSDGGYLVGGSSMLGEGGNITCEPHSSMADAILTKLDEDRNIEWQRCYGGSEHDGITALVEVSDGYVFGAYTSSNDGDVFGWHSGYNHLGNPETDMWIVKIDFDGNIIWQNALGGTKSDSPYRIFEDSFNSIFSFGVTYSNDGDVSGNHSLNEHYPDIWVVELNSDGVLIAQQCFGGEGREGIENGIVFKDRNHFVIAGYSNYGPSYDVGCTPHGGNWYDRDIWVFEVKDTTVSVQEPLLATTGITAYPNPARDYVCFERKGNESNRRTEISIFSASGIPVKELTLYPGENIKVWDTRSIRAGMYYYRSLRQDGTAEYGKIVLE
jgi:hypothetical protein